MRDNEKEREIKPQSKKKSKPKRKYGRGKWEDKKSSTYFLTVMFGNGDRITEEYESKEKAIEIGNLYLKNGYGEQNKRVKAFSIGDIKYV